MLRFDRSRCTVYLTAGIPYTIIDINPDTVRNERKKGEIIHYGDAGEEEILSHANVEQAMILVSTIPMTGDTKRMIRAARKLNPHIHIIIRSRFVREMEELYKLGADEVIPEEFETSVEIFTRVMTKYLVPHEEIEKLVAEVRADDYSVIHGDPEQRDKADPDCCREIDRTIGGELSYAQRVEKIEEVGVQPQQYKATAKRDWDRGEDRQRQRDILEL